MKIKLSNKPGYILPLTVILIFAMTFLVTRLVTRAYANVQVNRRVIDREKAKELALGGLTIVQAQLTHTPKDQKEQKKGKKQPEKTEKKYNFFKEFLQILNQWQTFKFTEKADGIDGSVKLYVASEDGKLSLNALWDYKNKKFLKKDGLDIRKLIENVVLKQAGAKSGEKRIAEELEKVLKKQDEPLEDVSQLLVNDYFKGLASTFFITPPDTTKKETSKKTELALSDIFTVAHDKLKVQPLFFSAGVKEVFDFKQLPNDEKQRKEIVKTLAEKAAKVLESSGASPEESKIDWKKEWDGMLSKVYGKPYKKLSPALTELFDTSVGATTISVLSYGTVGSVTQKVYAILQRVVLSDKRVTYVVRKLYWL